MRYEINVGRLRTKSPKGSDSVFRIAVLGDFSGRANRGEVDIGSSLAKRTSAMVTIDNFESLIPRFNPELYLNLNGGTVKVEIASIDDFHPDELYENVEVFSELSALRRRLQNTATYEKAAAELDAMQNDKSADSSKDDRRSLGTTVPRKRLSDFARLIESERKKSPTESSIDQLIAKLVAPHVEPSKDPQQDRYIENLDKALSASMRGILHHPDFQALESNWRSVDFLIRQLEPRPDLQVFLYDITAEEIAADLSSTDSLDKTSIYEILVEKPFFDGHDGGFSAVIANYVFEQSPPHVDLLGRIAKVAAAANAPFIGGLSHKYLEPSAMNDAHDMIQESWNALKELPEANFLGLVSPRFMLRWPYGAKTEPIGPFDFEEFNPQTGWKGMLWGNGAVLVGLLLAKTYSADGLSNMRLGSIMSVDDVPFYFYTNEHGDQVALPCTEKLLNERLAKFVQQQGCIPVLSMRGQNVVRLGGFNSVAGSLLSGQWAEGVSIPEAPETTTSSTELDDEKEPEESATPEADEHENDIATTEEGEEPATADDDELSSLLAELDADDEESNTEDDGEMDPELAALLADLE